MIGMSAAPSSALALVAGAKRSCMTARAAPQLARTVTISKRVTITER
jgi:hypothetical protein